MNRINSILLILILAIFVFIGGYLFRNGFFSSSESEPVMIPPELSVGPSAENHTPRIPAPARNPVIPPRKPYMSPEAPVLEPPLPNSLDEGDAYLKKRLPQLMERQDLPQVVTLEQFIQKLVLVIDQLPNKTINRQHLPINPPAPGFIASGSGEKIFIGQKNAARYRPYVDLVEAISDDDLFLLYRGLYPLFQQAYREIGHPNGHFNDRLIEVIAHLLQTPEPDEPLGLILHVRRYKYADESLEALSAGQKILLRMGLENSRRIKAKLERLQQGLVRKD